MRDTIDLLSRIEMLEVELGRLKALGMSQSPRGSDATPAPTEPQGSEPSSRRDLLRYGAVALAGAAAGMTGSPVVEAADGGAVVIGASNTGSETRLTTTAGDGFRATSASGNAGLVGEGGYGVYGSAVGQSGAGVYGIAGSMTGTSNGVRGYTNSPDAAAIYGFHYRGIAVRAEVPDGATTNAIALYALNYSTYTGGGPGAGGFAIYGLSANGHGLVGATAAAGGAAVVGATNGVAGAYAGAFYGPLIVGGNFTVFGGAKSAAVPHPDGSHRRLYCVESPESWFEDFGSGTLTCGEAVVPLDHDFAAVVDTSQYHVFLTGCDGLSDLSACERTSKGFRVKATTGAGDGTFSWRVVAKRKDIAAPRFETVEIPKAPPLPDVPASVHDPMPSPPDTLRRGAAPRRPKGKA
jgi:hypothetical protein